VRASTVRPLLLSKRRPHFKTRKSLGRTNIWSWPTGPETKNDCAGEDQQQFTGLNCKTSDQVIKIAEAVTHLACTRKVPCSIHGRATDCPD
jgi:hypothetical protein